MSLLPIIAEGLSVIAALVVLVVLFIDLFVVCAYIDYICLHWKVNLALMCCMLSAFSDKKKQTNYEWVVV